MIKWNKDGLKDMINNLEWCLKITSQTEFKNLTYDEQEEVDQTVSNLTTKLKDILSIYKSLYEDALANEELSKVHKYRKKPVVIDAIQFKGYNYYECQDFIAGKCLIHPADMVYFDNFDIETLEGTMKASLNDYIVKGVDGEFYPCKPEIFKQTYEIVDNDEMTEFEKKEQNK